MIRAPYISKYHVSIPSVYKSLPIRGSGQLKHLFLLRVVSVVAIVNTSAVAGVIGGRCISVVVGTGRDVDGKQPHKNFHQTCKRPLTVTTTSRGRPSREVRVRPQLLRRRLHLFSRPLAIHVLRCAFLAQCTTENTRADLAGRSANNRQKHLRIW